MRSIPPSLAALVFGLSITSSLAARADGTKISDLFTDAVPYTNSVVSHQLKNPISIRVTQTFDLGRTHEEINFANGARYCADGDFDCFRQHAADHTASTGITCQLQQKAGGNCGLSQPHVLMTTANIQFTDVTESYSYYTFTGLNAADSSQYQLFCYDPSSGTGAEFQRNLPNLTIEDLQNTMDSDRQLLSVSVEAELQTPTPCSPAYLPFPDGTSLVVVPEPAPAAAPAVKKPSGIKKLWHKFFH